MTQKRLTISIPEELSNAVDDRVESEGTETTRSAFIERALNTYLEGARNTAYYEQQIIVLQQDIAIKQESISTTNENIAQLEHELVDKDRIIADLTQDSENGHAATAECGEQIAALENALKESESSRQSVEENNRNLSSKLKAEEENHRRALAEQEHRHKDVVDEEERRREAITNALRHEQELAQTKLEATLQALQDERDHNREMRNDMEQLQKQLELVTLRLPAPNEGFWSRVFGRKREAKT